MLLNVKRSNAGNAKENFSKKTKSSEFLLDLEAKMVQVRGVGG